MFRMDVVDFQTKLLKKKLYSRYQNVFSFDHRNDEPIEQAYWKNEMNLTKHNM